jgi:hypothetical protein
MRTIRNLDKINMKVKSKVSRGAAAKRAARKTLARAILEGAQVVELVQDR